MAYFSIKPTFRGVMSISSFSSTSRQAFISMFRLRDCPPIVFSVDQHFFVRLAGKCFISYCCLILPRVSLNTELAKSTGCRFNSVINRIKKIDYISKV
jgi:hypothetical protein